MSSQWIFFKDIAREAVTIYATPCAQHQHNKLPGYEEGMIQSLDTNTATFRSFFSKTSPSLALPRMLN